MKCTEEGGVCEVNSVAVQDDYMKYVAYYFTFAAFMGNGIVTSKTLSFSPSRQVHLRLQLTLML